MLGSNDPWPAGVEQPDGQLDGYSGVRILYGLQPSKGWHPLTAMVRLLAELFEAELVVTPVRRGAGAWRRLAGLGRRRGREVCLVVAATPRDLAALLERDHWFRGYGRVAAWVIDSFWLERIPPAVRQRRHIRQLFITDKELVDPWATETGLPVRWLPWGADVLGLGSDAADRPVDLQRIGRQPPNWDDDEETREACEAAGLRFEGRPPMHGDAGANQRALAHSFSRAKFVLAFSNAVNPEPYTHPTREYLTARWTDALASGAVVAGVPPNCAATTELLWSGATLDLGTVDRREGIAKIVDAVRSWSPDVARENHHRALVRLDWRWRFRELAEALEIEPERLDAEIAVLAAAGSSPGAIPR